MQKGTESKRAGNLYLMFGKSVWYKIAFSAKLKVIQRHGRQLTGLTVKNGIFGSENSAVKGLKIINTIRPIQLICMSGKFRSSFLSSEEKDV